MLPCMCCVHACACITGGGRWGHAAWWRRMWGAAAAAGVREEGSTCCAGAPARAILTALPRRGLCAETGLALRDLRVVDPSFRGQLPAVLVRRGAIVVALQHVKAIITADRVLLFDAANPA